MNYTNVKFYLKRTNGDQPTAIYAKLQLNKKPFKYYIGDSIIPALWDANQGKPTSDSDMVKAFAKVQPQIRVIMQNIQTQIDKVRNAIVAFVNLQETTGNVVTSDQLRDHLDELLGKEKDTKGTKLSDYIDHFIRDIESGARLTPNKTRYSEGTIKNYYGFRTQWLLFQKEIRKTLDFDDITLDLYNRYIQFFTRKNYSINTIGRHVKALKVIMGAGKEDGLHQNKIYRHRKFQVLTAKIDSIYLSETEVQSIFDLDLSDSPHLDLARDVFLLGCYTTLRYSDVSRIKPHHVIEEGSKCYLNIYNQKTEKPTIVPLKPEALHILAKYENEIPKTYEQKVNKYIKEVGKMAGIDNQVEIIEKRGGLKLKKVVPKYQLIMTHTARRSGVTNMCLRGIDTLLIMKITNHASEKDLLKYIRISREESARKLASHEYFKFSDMKRV